MPGGADLIYRCNITWILFGQNVINSFFFRSKETDPLPTIPAALSDLHDDIRNHLIGSLRPIMAQDIQLLTSVLFNLNGPTFYEDVRTYSGLFGQVAQSSLPSYVAQVLSWRTEFRGRRVHGRTYVAGVPINVQNQNFLSSGGQSALDNAGSNIVGFFGDGGSCRTAWMVVYSRKNGTSINPGPPPFIEYSPLAGIPITRYVADSTLYTQRHRLQGRGI